MKKSTLQVQNTLDTLANQMMREVKGKDYDINIVYVKRGDTKTLRTYADTSLFGGMVVILDMMNRMGISDAVQQHVRGVIASSIVAPEGKTALVSPEDGRVQA